MKTYLLKHFAKFLGCGVLVAGFGLAAPSLMATPVVDTVSGGPTSANPTHSYGYQDGDTAQEAQFNGPWGLALDSTSGILYVADRTNNAIRKLDLDLNQTLTFLPNDVVPASVVTAPVGVAVDNGKNLYVLTRGNGSNGSVRTYDRFGDPLSILATNIISATSLTIDFATNVYFTCNTNTIKRIAQSGVISTISVVTNAGTVLQGIAVTTSGRLAVCDSGNHGIWLIDPSNSTNGNPTKLTGFNGQGDHFGTTNFAKFNQPMGVAAAGSDTLVVTDFGNHRVKVVDSAGTVVNLYGVCSNNWVTGPGTFPGWFDGNGCLSQTTCQICDNYAEARSPRGVLFAPDGDVYITEVYYHLIRKVTTTGLPLPPPPPPLAPQNLAATAAPGQVSLSWSPSSGATGYNVKRSPSSGGPYTTIATVNVTTNVDGSVVNGSTYYYVVSALNGSSESLNSTEVSITVPFPPVSDPQIGYVTFPPPDFTSVFHPASSVVFNNDVLLVIVGEAGTQTFYEYTNSLNAANVPNPTSSSLSAPVGYIDGLLSVNGLTVASVLPYLTIKAIGEHPGRTNSAVVTAQFQFIVGNPTIIGDNAARFSVSDITDGAKLYYTTDGSTPDPNTNSASSILAGTISGTNGISISPAFPNGTNLTVKVRGFKDNYQPSGTVTKFFSATNYLPNRITFGVTNGEPTSVFIARPGQVFYAPVTLQLQPEGETMYSLQFNVAVASSTNSISGSPAPAIVSGAGIGFASMLMSDVPKEHNPDHNPPPNFGYFLTIPPVVFSSTNSYVFSEFVNTNNNVLGVGWLFRPAVHYTLQDTNTGRYYLDYDTTKHDLIRYSIAHDTLFQKAGGIVAVGAYGFQVPEAAQIGDRYYIQLGSPSGTRDGVGAPGAEVYIQPPTVAQPVTVGSPSYLVGDAAPFHWLNAGDFGQGVLDNADVMQVFQSVVLNFHTPPINSDLYHAMDSCGRFGDFDKGVGYFVEQDFLSTNQAQALFDGNDQSINCVAFGDDNLDICDLFVTFRRSLDPNLAWFKRFWTNSHFAAVITTNLAFNTLITSNQLAQCDTSSIGPAIALQSSVAFKSEDAIASSGQVVQVPVKANVIGNYPLRVLGVSLTVTPLDGAPNLTQNVQFTPAGGLSSPTLTASKEPGNYAAAWLNSGISGLSGDATIGTLTVTLPAGAPTNSAYAIHFDHVSGSPNGIASFKKSVQSGLITLGDRSGSTWNDGIPDSWRLRYFGTVYNVLSAASADADGDGMSNWEEYIAGTDPNDKSSNLRASKGSAPGYTIRWPSVSGKSYVIERSTTLFNGSWSAISTNAGTGGDIEFTDTGAVGTSRFYRVRVAN